MSYLSQVMEREQRRGKEGREETTGAEFGRQSSAVEGGGGRGDRGAPTGEVTGGGKGGRTLKR